MHITFYMEWMPQIIAAWLFAARLSPMVLFAPPFNSINWPMGTRLLLTLALGAAMAASVPESFLETQNLTVMSLFEMLVTEVLSGAFMAFGWIGAFSSVSLAGRLIDMQIGFGVASLFDPTTNRQGSMLGSALAMLAGAFFFATDGHLLFFRVMADSAQLFPPGHVMVEWSDALWVARQYGYMFFAGVLLAFPVVLVLLLIDVGLAMASRSVPQLGVFFLSLPIKAATGLVALGILLMADTHAFSGVLWQMFSYLRELLKS